MEGITLSIQDLLNETNYGLSLTLLAGERGLSNRVSSARIQKPGLALDGYTEHLHPDRIQVLGNTEVSFLEQVDSKVATGNLREMAWKSGKVLWFDSQNGIGSFVFVFEKAFVSFCK